MELQTFDEILAFAIAREQDAETMYTELAERVTRPGMREAFLQFAAEERGHRERLERVRAGVLPKFTPHQVRDLKISDHLVEVEPSARMTYQEALVFAMKAEKAAFALYTRLSEMADDPAIAELFRALAQEEAKHKLRFELEYDDHVLEGN